MQGGTNRPRSYCLRATRSISPDRRVRGRDVNPSNPSSTIRPSCAHSSASLVAVYRRMRCSLRIVRPLLRRNVEWMLSTPDNGSNLRSCATIVPSRVSHQSRDRKRDITPSRLPPCHTKTPPGFSTRASSAIARASSDGLSKNPKDVKRFTTPSNRADHAEGSFRMSARR